MKKGLIIFSLSFCLVNFTSITVVAKSLPQKLPTKRGPASFTQGFKTIEKRCSFREAPKKNSKELFEVQAGRIIWFTALDSQWLIAKTKNKTQEVYLHSSCVN